MGDIDKIIQGLYAESYMATREHIEGNIDEAMKLYKENIARGNELATAASDPDRYRYVEFLTIAYIRRGLSYRRAGDLSSAIADFNHAVELVIRSGDMKLAEVYFYLANALIAEGNLAKAKQNYRQFLTGKPQGEFGEGFQLHQEFSLWASQNIEMLLADGNRAVEIDPQFAEALFCRGLVKQYMGEWSQALEDFRGVRQANPDNLLTERLLTGQERELDALQRREAEKIRLTESRDTAYFRPDIDYCSVDIAVDGQGYINVHFYGVNGEQRESHDGESSRTILDKLVADGWQLMISRYHQEGTISYFQRRKNG